MSENIRVHISYGFHYPEHTCSTTLFNLKQMYMYTLHSFVFHSFVCENENPTRGIEFISRSPCSFGNQFVKITLRDMLIEEVAKPKDALCINPFK